MSVGEGRSFGGGRTELRTQGNARWLFSPDRLRVWYWGVRSCTNASELFQHCLALRTVEALRPANIFEGMERFASEECLKTDLIIPFETYGCFSFVGLPDLGPVPPATWRGNRAQPPEQAAPTPISEAAAGTHTALQPGQPNFVPNPRAHHRGSFIKACPFAPRGTRFFIVLLQFCASKRPRPIPQMMLS